MFIDKIYLWSDIENEEDTTAPKIEGVKKLTVFIGNRINYNKGIKVTDNQDEAPYLEVDSSKVKKKQAYIRYSDNSKKKVCRMCR